MAQLVTLRRRRRAWVHRVIRGTLRHPSTNGRCRRARVFFTLRLLARGNHRFNGVLLFIISKELGTRPKGGGFTLFTIIGKKVRHRGAITHFLFRAARLLRAQGAIRQARNYKNSGGIQGATPRRPFRLVTSACSRTIGPRVRLPFTLFPHHPFNRQHAKELHREHRPPRFTLHLRRPRHTIRLRGRPVRARGVITTNFLAWVIGGWLHRAARRLNRFYRPLTSLRRFVERFTRHGAILYLLPNERMRVRGIIWQNSGLVRLFAVHVRAFESHRQ